MHSVEYTYKNTVTALSTKPSSYTQVIHTGLTASYKGKASSSGLAGPQFNRHNRSNQALYMIKGKTLVLHITHTFGARLSI
jgi:hypothetical protein